VVASAIEIEEMTATRPSLPDPRRSRRPSRTLLLAGAAALALTACELPVQVHGNLPDDKAIARLEPGKQGRADVSNLLGSPSATSTFQDKTWYYVGVKQTQFAFFSPDVKERNVLVLEFDENDTLARTQLYTQDDMLAVDLVDRETPTEGRNLTVVQQLLGNLGRFNTGDEGRDYRVGAPGPRPGP
jgi:outer membrane protein assembly factor BamE (lipoprotein component of BamABCDE complex)